MRLWRYGLGLVLALGLGAGLGSGCAAGSSGNLVGAGASGSGAGGAGASGAGASSTTTMSGAGATSSTTTMSGGGGMTSGAGGSIPVDASTPDGFGACAKFSAQAQQDPAAMLVLIQASSSMTLANKWLVAEQAVVQAIDADVFDTMSIGLMAWPNGFVSTPPCLVSACLGDPTCFGQLPMGVACGTPTAPQVPVAPAGTNKSSASTGVRHDMAQWLTANGPISENADAANSTPLYDAMKNGYDALAGVSIPKRMLLVITDGGGSCTSVDTPQRPAITDMNGCQDWELPTNVSTMITTARTDPNTPVETFIVGVPDSNSDGQQEGFYTTAPYSMLLALSTYAVAGSPTTVPANCDQSATWSQFGTAPAVPCHIDLSNTANFNPTALADAIATLRSKALGCSYNLPAPPMGQTLDKADVNVVIIINGQSYVIPRRKSPTDTCLVKPCWDYDANGKVDLIGVTCTSVQNSATAQVDIYVGCATEFN